MSLELLIVFQGVIRRGLEGSGGPAIWQGFQFTARTRSGGGGRAPESGPPELPPIWGQSKERAVTEAAASRPEGLCPGQRADRGGPRPAHPRLGGLKQPGLGCSVWGIFSSTAVSERFPTPSRPGSRAPPSERRQGLAGSQFQGLFHRHRLQLGEDLGLSFQPLVDLAPRCGPQEQPLGVGVWEP